MSHANGVRLLGQHLRNHRRPLRLLVLWSAVEALPTFVSGTFVAKALDDGFLAQRPFTGLSWLALLAALWTVGAVGTRQVYPWLAATVEPLRDSLVSAVVRQSLHRAVHGKHDATGASVSQITEQTEAVRVLMSTVLRNMRQVVIAGLAALVGLFMLSWLIAAVAATSVALALGLFLVLLRHLLARYRTVLLRGERVGEVAAPVVGGVRDVVTQAAEPRATSDVGPAIDEQAQSLRAFARAKVLRLPVITLGVHVPLISLLALSPWLLSSQTLTAGALAGGVVYLSGGLQTAIMFLVNAGSTLLVSIGVVLDRLAEVCTGEPPAMSQESGTPPHGYEVCLRHVTFSYSPHAQPVVDDLSIDIPSDMHLAVVGASGVGKSTLANLLARLAEPQHGQIHLGGVPVEDLDEHRLRREVGLIPQDAYVFAGTVRENLTYLHPHATTAELDHAVAAIGAEATVSRLGGYTAAIAPGGEGLSPGERQLIALVRVYLSPAHVVLLDEATCHLDPAAESKAEQAFAVRAGTLIVIAHRISSAQRAEKIIIMDGSAKPDIGTHDDLLLRNDRYAELVGHWRAEPQHAPNTPDAPERTSVAE